MGGQPRRERSGNGGRRRRRIRRARSPVLTVLTAVTALTACGEGGVARPGGGPGGIAGGPGLSEAIVGTWKRTLIIQEPDDIITSTTTWTFRTDGTCERAVTSSSVSAGISDTQTSPCTYTIDRTLVTIAFEGSTMPVTFAAAVSGDSLFLDDVEFQRE